MDNFQTDHDPRNPAYICTQGPLPHTVADFWQVSFQCWSWLEKNRFIKGNIQPSN